jgi:hypothetical protein
MEHCIFIHFGQKNYLDYPELRYLDQLVKYFTKVTLVTNSRDFLEDSIPSQVELKLVKNEGYDFGMFLKIFKEIDAKNLSRLVLANDSNVLLKDLGLLLNKGKDSGANFWGAIDSYEKPWFSSHNSNYHLQSHFLVWEKDAIPILQKYLDEIPLDLIYQEKDLKKVRRNVINIWEIGLSQYFISNNCPPKAVYSSLNLSNELGKKKDLNFTIKFPGELLELGYPFMKKKCVPKQKTWRKYIFPQMKWKELIRCHVENKTEAELLIESLI